MTVVLRTPRANWGQTPRNSIKSKGWCEQRAFTGRQVLKPGPSLIQRSMKHPLHEGQEENGGD